MPATITTLGDWIQVKRREKNLATYHLAAKMGIATALVQSWENGAEQPDSQQIETLRTILGGDSDTLWSGIENAHLSLHNLSATK